MIGVMENQRMSITNKKKSILSESTSQLKRLNKLLSNSSIHLITSFLTLVIEADISVYQKRR